MRRALWVWSPRQAMLPSVVTAAPFSPAGRMGTSAMSECSPYPPERTADLGGEQVLPLSASPHRADPRPPTLRSVGQDLATQIRNAAGGDPVLARSILDETLRDLHELDYVGATSGFSSQKESNTAALLLTSLKDYATGPLALPPSGGTRTVAQAASLAAIAAALHSTEVEQQRLVKAARELTGLSRSIYRSGPTARTPAQRMTRPVRSKFVWAEPAVVPLVQTRSTRTTVQGEALVLGVLTCAVKLQLDNKFTQGELHVVVVPEQPRACLLSHPTHSGAGSCSACSALLVGVDFKLNDAYASARGALGARARHAQRFSLAGNIGRGRLGFVVVVLLRSFAHLLIASLPITQRGRLGGLTCAILKLERSCLHHIRGLGARGRHAPLVGVHIILKDG